MTNLKLDQQLCFAVYSAAHAFTRFYKPLLGALGLTYPQYLVLLVLWERDGQSVSAIGEKLLLDSGTLTPLLKRMEAMGLVTRKRADHDERRVLVHLLPPAMAMKSVAEGFPQQMVAASSCSGEEIDILRRTLVGLREQLDATTAAA